MGQEMEMALNELGCSIGLGPLSFNEAGQCLLVCDDLLVVLEVSGDGHALTMLCQLGDGQSDMHSVAALERSNSLFNTHGFCLAVETQTKSPMLLCRASRAQLGESDLSELLSDFVNAAKTLVDSLFDAPHPAAETTGWLPAGIAV